MTLVRITVNMESTSLVEMYRTPWLGVETGKVIRDSAESCGTWLIIHASLHCGEFVASARCIDTASKNVRFYVSNMNLGS